MIDGLAPGICKVYRTFIGYMNIFLNAGFDISGIIKWLPTDVELSTGKVSEMEELRPLF